MSAVEEARDRWREHALACLRCGFDRMRPTGATLDERWKSAARAGYEARRNAGPVTAYLREFDGGREAASVLASVAPRAPVEEMVGRVRAADWTDDEWIAAMAQFSPNAPIAEVERWIAARQEGAR